MKNVELHEEYLNATGYGTFDENTSYLQPGITIIKWLEGLAMASIITSNSINPPGGPALSPEETAVLAKEYAAAMLPDTT